MKKKSRRGESVAGMASGELIRGEGYDCERADMRGKAHHWPLGNQRGVGERVRVHVRE